MKNISYIFDKFIRVCHLLAIIIATWLQKNHQNYVSGATPCMKFLYSLTRVTVKWSDTEQRGNIEQSYLFHGNSLDSVYNSHVARCLWHRSLTKGFCPQPQKFSECPTTFNLLFCLEDNFQTKKLMLWDKALTES